MTLTAPLLLLLGLGAIALAVELVGLVVGFLMAFLVYVAVAMGASWGSALRRAGEDQDANRWLAVIESGEMHWPARVVCGIDTLFNVAATSFYPARVRAARDAAYTARASAFRSHYVFLAAVTKSAAVLLFVRDIRQHVVAFWLSRPRFAEGRVRARKNLSDELVNGSPETVDAPSVANWQSLFGPVTGDVTLN